MYSKLHNGNIGSVSSATMRPEDLIPAFLWELEHQDKLLKGHKGLIKEINSRMEAEDYYETEDSGYDLEDLFDALNEYAMPGFYFGSHPGDGADYGFWLDEDIEHNFDGLKVDDLSEIPTGYIGEVLHVNDHGNMTLYYNGANGRLYEIWSIV